MADEKKDQPLHMLGYWVDKKGMEEGLEEMYPNLLKNNLTLATRLDALRAAEAALKDCVEDIMENSEEEDDA